MEKDVEITICMGSSCFSRGNDRHLKIIEEYLTKNNLKLNTKFQGCLCTDNCKNGPVVYINKNLYKSIDRMSLVKAFDNELK